MKKVLIGCLGTLGFISLVVLIVVVINAVFLTEGDKTTPTETATGDVTASTQPAQEVELVAAANEGLIEVSAFGTGYKNKVHVSLVSNSDSELRVSIFPGTVFQPQSASIMSSMVVINGMQLTLSPNGTLGPVSVIAGCTSLRLEVPDNTDMLSLGSSAGGDLAALLCMDGFGECDYRIQQLAIWTIADNLGRNDDASCGGGDKITDEEVETIRGIFGEAGISVEGYRALQEVVYVELAAAVQAGLVEASAIGAGSIDRVGVSLASKSDDILRVSIMPGVIFTASAAGVQSMVIITWVEVLLDPYEEAEPFYMDAACANMELDAPGDTDTMQLSSATPSEDLLKLLELEEFCAETTRVKQFAIWTITDNPARDGYVGIGYWGMGSGPSDEEMEAIRTLFINAGISTEEYQALS